MGEIVLFSLLGGARAVFAGGVQSVGYAPFALLAIITMWWLTPWLLLERRIRLRLLIPTALLTGGGMSAYFISAAAWMPTTVAKNQAQFGFFGVALALVTFLTGAAAIIVVGAVAGSVCADDRGRLGTLIRGSAAD